MKTYKLLFFLAPIAHAALGMEQQELAVARRQGSASFERIISETEGLTPAQSQALIAFLSNAGSIHNNHKNSCITKLSQNLSFILCNTIRSLYMVPATNKRRCKIQI